MYHDRFTKLHFQQPCMHFRPKRNRKLGEVLTGHTYVKWGTDLPHLHPLQNPFVLHLLKHSQPLVHTQDTDF
ncbi:hypothetical protein EX30DRAFT_84459 [Ascodesmis nigricans]|uniref:Uncharacterized protein n=1 Tax=Ascodesmis nigricans TaxID=341454 RepID=A0A4V6RHH4_9PEZI|nr:hypothetical protein EX30DRAFT_84459 [Ascodesmis nigricans]